MFGAILVIFTVFAGQLLRIQAFDASATQAAAFNKRLVQTLTPAMRGQILDTNGQVLADSVERYTVAANPDAVPAYKVRVDGSLTQVGVAGAVSALAPLLDMSVARPDDDPHPAQDAVRDRQEGGQPGGLPRDPGPRHPGHQRREDRRAHLPDRDGRW